MKISQESAGEWSILVKNVTTGESFSTSTSYGSSMDTAEWIEETPLEIGTGGTGVAAMPSLSTVHFRKGTLNGANPSYQTVDEMQLNSNGKILATPSGPNLELNAFNDCTYATSCAAP